MNPRQLLRAIREAEISIRLEGGQVILSPAERITPEIAAYTAHHKEHLVWILQRRSPDTPPHEVWISDPVREQWIRRLGLHRGQPGDPDNDRVTYWD